MRKTMNLYNEKEKIVGKVIFENKTSAYVNVPNNIYEDTGYYLILLRRRGFYLTGNENWIRKQKGYRNLNKIGNLLKVVRYANSESPSPNDEVLLNRLADDDE